MFLVLTDNFFFLFIDFSNSVIFFFDFGVFFYFALFFMGVEGVMNKALMVLLSLASSMV